MTYQFTTSTGKTFEVRPVSEYLVNLAKSAAEREFREKGEPLDPPTYTVEIAGGGSQTFQHDEITAKELTGEELETWKRHIDARQRLAKVQNDRTLKVWLSGVIIPEGELENPEWRNFQESVGVEIPTNDAKHPRALEEHYLTTVAMITPDDFMQALGALTKASYQGTIREEAVDAALQSFQRYLSGNPIDGSAGGRGQPVAAQPSVRRSKRGNRKTAHPPEPVPDVDGAGQGGDVRVHPGEEPHGAD